MTNNLTREQIKELRNNIENIGCDLSNLEILAHYLIEDIDKAEKRIRGEEKPQNCDLASRIFSLACMLQKGLKEASNEQYKIFNSLC